MTTDHGPSARPGPVFVGGTGRSGTTITGELIGARVDVSFVPVELRLHVDPSGLTDLAAGQVTFRDFAIQMRRKWFMRRANTIGQRGLHVVAERVVMRESLHRLRDTLDDDRTGACARYLTDVLTPLMQREGTDTFVEMTPPNAQAMDGLCRMFPHARVVHMSRDGRDVAASVARRKWGPNDIESALVWWGDSMARIAEARSGCDPEQVLDVRLEALVGPRRDEEYQRLVDFLGRGDDESMRRYFDENLSAQQAHGDTWRRGLDAELEWAVETLYAEQLERLDALGMQLPRAD